MSFSKSLLMLILTAVMSTAAGSSTTASDLRFVDGWARATPPGATTAAIYGTFVNSGTFPVRIQKITLDIAAMIMIHQTVVESDMVKMVHVADPMVEPGGQMELSPGGKHLMLMGLKRALVEGEWLKITILTGDGVALSALIKVGAINQVSIGEP